ncbi:MAG: hypothetical protein RL173_1306, partial [Fibrobacterota bacterium]
GGAATAVLNAANEQAVALFLDRKVPYMSIVKLVEKCLEEAAFSRHPDFDELLAADVWARRRVTEIVATGAAS